VLVSPRITPSTGLVFVSNGENPYIVYWSVTSVVVISIVLLATSPKTDAAFVFTNFSNTTGWSDGTAWMLGLLQSALSFVGSVRSTITDSLQRG
jgi:hypothetical protein